MKPDIDILLNKYWEAETSVEEEAILKSYFNSEEIADQYVVYKPVFQAFNMMSNTTYFDSRTIDSLLEKYWQGETTLKEDKVLRAYFASDTISEGHKGFKDYFDYLNWNQNIKFSSDPNILAEKPKTKETRVISIKKWTYAVAAVFVLGLSSLFVFNQIVNTETKNSLVHEIDDPEEAYRVTMQALAMLSYKYQKSENVFKENIIHLNAANILSN